MMNFLRSKFDAISIAIHVKKALLAIKCVTDIYRIEVEHISQDENWQLQALATKIDLGFNQIWYC